MCKAGVYIRHSLGRRCLDALLSLVSGVWGSPIGLVLLDLCVTLRNNY
jgi:hypothetical protein